MLPFGGRVNNMNIKTLAIAALFVVGLAAVPAASADSVQDNGPCSVSGFVDITDPLNPQFNTTITPILQCISATTQG